MATFITNNNCRLYLDTDNSATVQHLQLTGSNGFYRRQIRISRWEFSLSLSAPQHQNPDRAWN